jgi:hypothetical protein
MSVMRARGAVARPPRQRLEALCLPHWPVFRCRRHRPHRGLGVGHP